MSFILDALKKVEENRRQDHAPDLMTVHQKQETVTKKRSPWPYILFAAILLNAVLLTVWLIPRQSPKDGTAPEIKIEEKENNISTQTSRKIAASTPGKDESEVSVDPVPAEKTETPPATQTAVLKDDKTKINAGIETDGSIPDINELPSSMREDMPEIKISGHVYFETPEDRLVIVNGRTAREGQTVASGLQIEEITSSGVIFVYDNRRFSMKGF
jgi:hypothetical protein